MIEGRIRKAIAQYEKKFEAAEAGKYYTTDLIEVREIGGGDLALTIAAGLKAGYMIGYRKGLKDGKAASKR